jgi:hypothetical protein
MTMSKAGTTIAQVTLYLCPACGSRCDTRESATTHCFCNKCGKYPVRRDRTWRGEECERCFLKRRILEEQGQIRKHRETLASSEAHLAKMQGEYDALKDAT